MRGFQGGGRLGGCSGWVQGTGCQMGRLRRGIEEFQGCREEFKVGSSEWYR